MAVADQRRTEDNGVEACDGAKKKASRARASSHSHLS